MIYVDESGKIYRPQEQLPTLAAVFITNRQSPLIQGDFALLRESAHRWGANIEDPEFEFSTRRILAQRDYFEGISRPHAIKLLRKIANIITRNRVITLTVCFNQPEAGRSLGPAFSFVQTEENIPDRFAGLFFGLIVGICAKYDFEAMIVADKDFLHGPYWPHALEFTHDAWPLLRGKGLFKTWEKFGEPEWNIGNTINTGESYQEVGIQIADLLANTIRRKKRSATYQPPYHELESGSLRETPGYKLGFPGVDVYSQQHIISTKPPWREKGKK